MITVYVGTQPNISGEVIDVLSYPLNNLWDQVQTPSLFSEQKLFILKNIFEDESLKKEIFTQLKLVKDAVHDIAIITDKVLVADKKVLEKIATIKESKKEVKKDVAYNPFAFGNAFATGDKKKTWIAFQELLTHDDEMEKTHGLIWWKLKDMLSKRSPFSREELITMARELVGVYHESRLGGIEMKDRLEKFFLGNK